MKIRVITGGQRGIDLAALRAAKSSGLPTGGYAPKGWQTEDGPNPGLAAYGLTEFPIPGYPARTEANVDLADAVLVIGDQGSPGSKLTVGLCRKKLKPFLAFETLSPSTAARAILELLPEGGTLMVAGNRESVNPGIEAAATELLTDAFAIVAGSKS